MYSNILDLTHVSWGDIHIVPNIRKIFTPTPIQTPIPTVEDVCMKLNILKNVCCDCGCSVFYSLRKWNMRRLCYACHSIRYIQLMKEVELYLIEKGHIKCAFCEKPRTNPHDFHLDHVNMFSKKGSVGPMMYDGESIDSIKSEIDKCQLLCLSCHAAVTHFEHTYGFIKAKKHRHKHTKQYKMNMYDEYMEVVYAALRRHGKTGANDTISTFTSS